MSRSVSIYVCQSCGAQTRQFFGRCNNCGEWNSIIEEKINQKSDKSIYTKINSPKEKSPYRSELISRTKDQIIDRIPSGYDELDRVLGGGLVPGSLVLIGGDPGIGKSTLILQSATKIAHERSVLYVAAEESAQQVKLRWNRIENSESNLHLLAETDLELVIKELDYLKPEVAVIDSIQALHDQNLSSSPGSVAQVRECSAALQQIAKRQNISLLIIGHVTKDGMLAGPKVLEHLVDAVLTFEGDRFASHRLLRGIKNRFGATCELGVFEMQADGLSEVSNPSELFLSKTSAPGISTIVTCEGTRPLAIDIQALLNPTSYASPRRTATGVEINRLHQILAVLEKNMNLSLSRYDCYLAVAGGLEVEEPGADLGIAAAIVSSHKDIELAEGVVFIGEIGLAGQLRLVRQMQQRINEVIRLGYKTLIIPEGIDTSEFEANQKFKILKASNINQALIYALNNI